MQIFPIMSSYKNEKRSHQRRVLQVPVICYPSGSRCEPQDWIFGKTIDVGMDGLRIRFRGACLLEAGAELDLLILESDGQELTHQAGVPACIRSRVSWVDAEEQVFGVEYLT